MSWIERIFGRRGQVEAGEPRFAQRVEDEISATRRLMTGSLIFSLQARDPELGIAEHCALVSVVSDLIARQIGTSEGDAYILRSAAQLHEIGLLAVPPELLTRRAPLARRELEQVRTHARVGAQIVRAAHHPRVAFLVENQYEDHRELQKRKEVSARDLLLAGIFRVADVITAITWPRPYQEAVPAEYRAELLRGGAGTRFHPLAVHFALQLRGVGETGA